ncbi:MAG: nucleotide exchange factor GrpE [Bacteroidota bacterium]
MAKKSKDKQKNNKAEQHLEDQQVQEKDREAFQSKKKEEASEANNADNNSKKKKEDKVADKKTDKEKDTGVIDPEEKIRELQDKYLRLSAEFDNYRKRTLKERAELLKSAGEETLIKILPVLDDFERALVSMEESSDIEAVKSGIQLIYSKLKETLTQQGLKEIPAMGEEFDTDIHEAITKIPAPDEKLKGKIVDVVEKGYYLNEKVIRYSKVVIGE